ncbi:hypothetical protein GCM10010435_84910 [Winogradskya consettensis]|uniref:Uncharacterized protein n=2 Tax=Winogradskya TaxID=3240235 RepID=A0A919SIJ8_9ACTN|nr:MULTISPECIES: hypothetical protein [Actinoplanes]GIE20336.1 hypothetical protein Ahu01nite_034380 [Actinoplanes humidus]GIM72676.1 hypothetical protein Aco04nite_31490 [Actinoplanes consettensis]
MSTPSMAPPQRDPAEVAPANSYHKADPVWVYRNGWRAGVIEASSVMAVTVTYRPGSHMGTGVDTFTAPYVTYRADEDPALDRRQENALAFRRPKTGGDGAALLGFR